MLAGKVAALLTYAAVTLAGIEVVAWITARVLAPGAGIDTSAWTSLDAVGAAITDYGAVLLWIAGYALLGTALAVVLRSVTVALAVGIAWFGPFEHIVEGSWSGAARVFLGLSLEAFAAGGTSDVTVARASRGHRDLRLRRGGPRGHAVHPARRDRVTHDPPSAHSLGWGERDALAYGFAMAAGSIDREALRRSTAPSATSGCGPTATTSTSSRRAGSHTFLDDPYVERVEREPLFDEVTVASHRRRLRRARAPGRG